MVKKHQIQAKNTLQEKGEENLKRRIQLIVRKLSVWEEDITFPVGNSLNFNFTQLI
jgi:hypothetical protein